MHTLSRAVFLRAAGQVADLLPAGLPEVAFAGRSNVGKSSAINALTGRRKLARTSKTPGRTQTINFYSIGEEARLVDLPGYGYARVPQAMRRQWDKLVGEYLRSRDRLVAVVIVMDARHPMTPLDAQLVDWLDAERCIVLLSKCDKLSRREQAAALESTQACMGERSRKTRVLLFSSVTRHGVAECRSLLEHWLEQADGIKDPR